MYNNIILQYTTILDLMEDYLMTEKERTGEEFDSDNFDSTYKMMVKGPIRLLQVIRENVIL